MGLVGFPVPVVVARPRFAARPVDLDHHKAADHSQEAGDYVEGEACRDVPAGGGATSAVTGVVNT